MNPRASRVATLLVIAPFLLALAGRPARGQTSAGPTNLDREAIDLMNKAVGQTVSETGAQAIGVGSWISGKYTGVLSGGTSDHDLRVVVNGENNRKALEIWKDFQAKLRENIIAMGGAKRLSPDQVQKLINSTNVYPPSQLVAAVETAEDAADLFAKAGATPNLGGAAPEGFWGPGSKPYIHYYEDKAGKLFYVDPKTGRVMTGATDLTHLTEGLEALTTDGEVNRGVQCMEKALEELDAGRLDKTAKQAARLQQALKKARGLERLGAGGSAYLDDVVNGTIKDPDTIRAALAKAEEELRLLGSLSAETDVATRSLLRGVLGAENSGMEKVSRLFWKYSGKVPWAQFAVAFQAYMNYAAVRDASNMSPADFNAAVLNTSSKQLAWMTGIFPGLTLELADAALEAIRSGAYGFVTAYQDCTDLASGVHSVKGREDVNKGMSVDQMATTFPDTVAGNEALSNFVTLQARQASSRLENGAWVEDANISGALFNKCYTPIVKMWRQNRLARITAFNALYLDFEKRVSTGKALLSIQPGNPVPLEDQSGTRANVSLDASTTWDPEAIAGLVEKMNAILSFLDGAKGGEVLFATTAYTFSLDKNVDPKRYEPVHKQVVYSSPGSHEAHVDVMTNIAATVASDDVAANWVLRDFTKRYAASATLPFTVVAGATPVVATVSISGPAEASVGDIVLLSAVVKFPGGQTVDGLRYRWTDEGTGLRFSSAGGFQSLNTSRPLTYAVRVDVFVVQDGREQLLGSGRQAVRIDAAPDATVARTPPPVSERPVERPPQRIPLVPDPPKPAVQAPPKIEGPTDDQIVAEYRALLPAVLQAEKKAWHTKFEFIANAVKDGNGYHVNYKTYCLIDKGPDAGKDYVCYEFDTVLSLGAVKAAVADMKKRLGR